MGEVPVADAKADESGEPSDIADFAENPGGRQSSPSCSWSKTKIDAVVVASGDTQLELITSDRTPLGWT
jgi:hypothetical protein